MAGPMCSETYREDDDERTGEALTPSDFAQFKLNAEVLFTGSCHPPAGKAVTECAVGIQLGKWSKNLRVSGDREWTSSGMSKPKSFTSMSLDYAHAFGGSGFEQNPVGKGAFGSALPNVEAPDRIITSRSDKPAPASFGPKTPVAQAYCGSAAA